MIFEQNNWHPAGLSQKKHMVGGMEVTLYASRASGIESVLDKPWHLVSPATFVADRDLSYELAQALSGAVPTFVFHMFGIDCPGLAAKVRRSGLPVLMITAATYADLWQEQLTVTLQEDPAVALATLSVPMLELVQNLPRVCSLMTLHGGEPDAPYYVDQVARRKAAFAAQGVPVVSTALTPTT